MSQTAPGLGAMMARFGNRAGRQRTGKQWARATNGQAEPRFSPWSGPTRRAARLIGSTARGSNQSASIIPVILVIPNVGMYSMFGSCDMIAGPISVCRNSPNATRLYAAASDGPDISDAPVAGLIGRVYG